MPKRITELQKKAVILLYFDGKMTGQEIADVIGISPFTIYKLIRESGREKPTNKLFSREYRPRTSPRQAIRRVSDEERSAIQKDHANGLSIQDISTKYNRNANTVRFIISGKKQKRIALADIGQDRRRKLTPEDIEEIKEYFKKGERIHTIKKMFNVSDTCIRYHVFPEYKEYVNKHSREWHVLNVTPEEDARKSKERSLRYRSIISAMSKEEQDKYLK